MQQCIDAPPPRGQRTTIIDEGERVSSWAYSPEGGARLVLLATRINGVWELIFGDGEVIRIPADRLPSIVEAVCGGN